jgi:predicted ribonuclease YlaK
MAKQSRSKRQKRDRVSKFAKKQGMEVNEEFMTPVRSKPLTVHDLNYIQPMTDVQRDIFESWASNMDMNLMGSAGTGKTFLAMFLALREVLDPSNDLDKVMIVRSIVPVRDVGFLPGELEEKIAPYEQPYILNASKLIKRPTAYKHMKDAKQIEFVPTSFIQGTTFDNTVIIVDESENLNFQELDAIYTRMGKNTRIIFCGDTVQNCLKGEASGIEQFSNVVKNLRSMATITLTGHDIVRCKKVKEYILARDSINSPPERITR